MLNCNHYHGWMSRNSEENLWAFQVFDIKRILEIFFRMVCYDFIN